MNKTKRNIYESAVKAISESGYAGATMDDIASNAGVAKGTLYYHFKSKEEIFNFIVEEGLMTLEKLLKKEVEDAVTYLDKITAICLVNLRFIRRNRDLVKIILSQSSGQEVRQLHLRELLKKYVDFIETYVNTAMEEGIIKEGNASFVASVFLGMIVSSAVYEMVNEEAPSEDQIAKELIEYLTLGINV